MAGIKDYCLVSASAPTREEAVQNLEEVINTDWRNHLPGGLGITVVPDEDGQPRWHLIQVMYIP